MAVVLIAAAAALITSSPDALAHGIHDPVSSPNATAHMPHPDAGWWAAAYGRVEHDIGAMFKAARSGDALGPLLSVMLLAFGHGVLHAIGPGHGKLLLASYMTATRAPAVLGAAIALAAAGVQAAIAISVVLTVAVGLKGLADTVPALQNMVNTASLLVLTALGLAIVLRQLAALKWLPQPIARRVPASTCVCCGHDDHAHGAMRHQHPVHDHHSHRHRNTNAQGEDRQHFPLSTLGVIGVACSMGARPCTSAFAILLLALANDLLGLGIAATVAMALGVACTLAMVAVFTVDVRNNAGVAFKRALLPDNAMGMISLGAGALLTSIAIAGLAQAAAK